MGTKKTSIISVRVEASVKESLSIEGELENLTLNTLIGRILKRHVEWEKFAEDIGFISSTKPFLRSLLDSVTDKKVEEIAKTTCKSAFRDAVIYRGGKLNLLEFLKTLDLWLSSSHIPFRHIIKNDSERYIIQHELGHKWSLYITILISSILGDIEYKIVNLVKTEQSVSFKIEHV